MKKNAALVLLWLFCCGFSLSAAVCAYSEGGLSVTFPDTWKVNNDDDILEATSSDGMASVYIAMIYDTRDISSALEVYQDDLFAIMDDFQPVGEGKDMTINGLKCRQLTGKANIDTLMVETGVCLVETAKGVVMAVTYNTAGSGEQYRGDFDKIIRSMRRL